MWVNLKKQMKILRIIYDFADINNVTGGLSPAPYELSLAQATLNDKIYVLCGNLNKKNLLKGRFFYKIGSNITVYNLPRALPHFGPFLTTSIFVLPCYFYLKFFKNIDLVHNHQHLGVWFLLYKKIFSFIDKTPVFGHFHVTAKGRETSIIKSEGFLPVFTKYFEYPIHKFSDYLMSKVCVHIFCVAKNIKDEVIKYYKVPTSKITITESAVSVKKFTTNIKKIDTGFNNDSVILGYIGRISSRKGVDLMIEALKVLPGKFKLVLWGEFQDKKYEKSIYKKISDYKLNNRFKYMGEVDYFKNQNAFASINIFLLPSVYEGLPKVILEALVAKCMVIASGFKIEKNIPNLHFLSDLKVKTLVSEVISGYTGKNEYDKTLKIISEHYSYEQRAEKIKLIYTQLLSK